MDSFNVVPIVKSKINVVNSLLYWFYTISIITYTILFSYITYTGILHEYAIYFLVPIPLLFALLFYCKSYTIEYLLDCSISFLPTECSIHFYNYPIDNKDVYIRDIKYYVIRSNIDKIIYSTKTQKLRFYCKLSSLITYRSRLTEEDYSKGIIEIDLSQTEPYDVEMLLRYLKYNKNWSGLYKS